MGTGGMPGDGVPGSAVSGSGVPAAGLPAGGPWPGRLPSPAPSVLVEPPRPALLLDEFGRMVVVTERGTIPAAPASFGPDAGTATLDGITAWAGPWPVDERWWDRTAARQLARMQLVDTVGRAYLVCFDLSAQQWLLEGVYD
jgi:protein ImuB